MKSSIIKDAMALTIITLVAGLALGFTNDITAGPIAQQQQKAKEEAYKAVFADANTFKEVKKDDALQSCLDENGYAAQRIDEVMQAVDASGNPIGYAFTVTTTEGYGGDIQFAMGVKDDGTLNKKVEKFTYTKSGATSDDQIDAISGATITTNAMTNGVNAGLCAFQYEEGGNN